MSHTTTHEDDETSLICISNLLLHRCKGNPSTPYPPFRSDPLPSSNKHRKTAPREEVSYNIREARPGHPSAVHDPSSHEYQNPIRSGAMRSVPFHRWQTDHHINTVQTRTRKSSDSIRSISSEKWSLSKRVKKKTKGRRDHKVPLAKRNIWRSIPRKRLICNCVYPTLPLYSAEQFPSLLRLIMLLNAAINTCVETFAQLFDCFNR